MPPPEPTDLFAAFPPVPTEAWEAQIARDLKGADYARKLIWQPSEGFAVRPYYRAADRNQLPHLQSKEALATLRRHRRNNPWQIRQDFPSHDPAAANAYARVALDQGAEALGFVLERAETSNLKLLLTGLDLSTTPIHLVATAHPKAVLDAWLAATDALGFAPHGLRGTLTVDLLAQGVRTESWPAEDELGALAEMLARGYADAPGLELLAVDAQPYHEAGGTAVHELAFALAAASEYLATLQELGLTLGQMLRQMHTVFPVGASYFLHLAKLRAWRLLYARLAEAYAPDAEELAPAYVQAVTSGWNQTLYDPYVNVLRGTTEAAAAVLGGCDVLVVRPHTTPAGTPEADAYRLARNTQLILRHECGFDAVADPAAGSYYIEQLTHELGQAAWTLFQEVEAQGGYLAAARSGFLQQQLADARAAQEEAIAHRKHVFVGTNQYPNPEERRRAEAPPHADAHRGATPFEHLRLRTEQHTHTPTVLLLPFGHRALRAARATFARNFFGCAGYAIEELPGFDTQEDAIAAAEAHAAEIVVLCSSDPDYAAWAAPLCAAWQRRTPPPLLLVAGYPQEHLDALRTAGIDDFIHLRTPLLETLEAYHERLGIA